VIESAAVAVKSEYAEDEVKVVVILKKDSQLTPEELIRYLEPRIPYFMVPRYIEFKAELPKTPNGKDQKGCSQGRGSCRERLGSRKSGDQNQAVNGFEFFADRYLENRQDKLNGCWRALIYCSLEMLDQFSNHEHKELER